MSLLKSALTRQIVPTQQRSCSSVVKPRMSTACFSQPSSSGSVPLDRPPQPQYYPGIEEELEVSYDAYHSAFEDSKPELLKVPGLQEFAASLWQRRSSIPTTNFKDPLKNIFDEFDTDNDGILHSPEIAKALSSYGVAVQWYITMFEESKAPYITRCEFPAFIFSMAIGDLHAHNIRNGESTDSCDLP
eukprot:gene7353-476_t